MESGVVIDALRAEVAELTAELTTVATNAEMDIAAKSAEIVRISEELAVSQASVTALMEIEKTLSSRLADLEAGQTVSAEEIAALEVQSKATNDAVKAHMDEIAAITAQLGFNQGQINVLVEIQKIQDANTQLAADYRKKSMIVQ